VEAGADEAGGFIALGFTLPPGAYATAVLREIAKDGLREYVADGRMAGDP
jgi:tRNA(Glu) U13 pseudouridine synthase TruD